MMKWRSSRTRKADGDEQQEELVLFRDMLQRRDTDRILTLLQPAVLSDDLLDSANSLYRLPSAKRSSSSSGLGLLELTDNKNDYDWLKTPPATPLFPSLEMEVNAPELALHRDIPVIQHLSRFAGGISEQATTKANGATIFKSHMPKPKNNPSRSVTPGNGARPTPPAPTRPLRPMTPSAMRVQQAPQPDHKLAPKIIQFNNKISCNSSSAPSLNTAGPGKDSKSKSWRGRGVSPMVRSRTPAASNIPVGFSDDETLVPIRTDDRSSSASRSRPSAAFHPKQEPVVLVVKPRRQSCSPSMARGRKTAEDNIIISINHDEVDKNRMKNVGGNGSLAFGSKMVEKVMNARKSVSVAQEKEANLIKAATRIAMHEISSGFRGIKSKTSLDMPLKHTEIRRDPSMQSSRPPSTTCK